MCIVIHVCCIGVYAMNVCMLRMVCTYGYGLNESMIGQVMYVSFFVFVGCVDFAIMHVCML